MYCRIAAFSSSTSPLSMRNAGTRPRGLMAEGSLRPVLQSFGLSNRGLHMYFPRRSQAQPKLRTFIDFVKQALRVGRG
jgi:DNA-binding transcriptional LysR family regulator